MSSTAPSLIVGSGIQGIVWAEFISGNEATSNPSPIGLEYAHHPEGDTSDDSTDEEKCRSSQGYPGGRAIKVVHTGQDGTISGLQPNNIKSEADVLRMLAHRNVSIYAGVIQNVDPGILN